MITNSVIGRNCIIGEDKILLDLFVAVPCKAFSFSYGHFAYVIYHIKKLLTLLKKIFKFTNNITSYCQQFSV